MSKKNISSEVNNCLQFIASNTHAFYISDESLRPQLNDWVNFVYKAGNTLSSNEQEALFQAAMKNYSFLAELVRDDLAALPSLLRFALMSRILYNEGPVEHPEEIAKELADLLDRDETDLYKIDEIGHRIFNLREAVLSNPKIDLIVLEDEFENSGDLGNLSAIIRNPICPSELIETIRNREHFVFDEGVQDDESLDELVNEANEVS